MNWKGRVLDPNLQNGRSECTFRLSGTDLVAVLKDGNEMSLHLGDVDYICRGYERKEYVFRKKNADHPLFSTNDPGLIKAIRDANIIEFHDALHRHKKDAWKSRRKKYIIPFVLLILSIVGGAWFITYPAVDMAVAITPISLDREVGKIAIASMQGDRVNDPVVTEAIDKIVDRLVANVPNKEFQFNVRVIDDPMINAFAAPGGEIVVMTGLIKKSDSPEEVAGVIAHEICHVTHRHGLRKIYRQAIFVIAIGVILGDVGILADTALEGASDLADLGFSRSMEREADIEGHKLLVKADIDPSGLRSFFEKLAKMEDGKADASPTLLRTHPHLHDRIEYLHEEQHNTSKKFKKLDIDWEDVKSRLK